MNGGLYKGAKPVLWSVVEQTALAEAEVEYHDHTSTTVWVRFPVTHSSRTSLRHAAAVIWTTTPWTLPGNRAIAYSADLEYAVIQVDETGDGSRAVSPHEGALGEKLLVAMPLIEDFCAQAGIARHTVVDLFPGSALVGTVARHPLNGQGYDFERAAVAGRSLSTRRPGQRPASCISRPTPASTIGSWAASTASR